MTEAAVLAFITRPEASGPRLVKGLLPQETLGHLKAINVQFLEELP